MKLFAGVVIEVYENDAKGNIKNAYVKAIKYLDMSDMSIKETDVRSISDIIGCNITLPYMASITKLEPIIPENHDADYVSFITKDDRSHYTFIPMFINDELINTIFNAKLSIVEIKDLGSQYIIRYDFNNGSMAIYNNNELKYGYNIPKANMFVKSYWSDYDVDAVNKLEEFIKNQIDS